MIMQPSLTTNRNMNKEVNQIEADRICNLEQNRSNLERFILVDHATLLFPSSYILHTLIEKA